MDDLLALPGHYGETEVARGEAQTLTELIPSPELARLLDEAYAGNLNLQGAWARIEQAGAAAREARAGLFPALRSTVQAERTNAPFGGGAGQPGAGQPGSPSTGGGLPANGTSNRFSASLGASYEIDLWGRLRGLRRAAHFEVEAARRDADSLAISLAAEVAGAWVETLLAGQRELVLQAQLEASENILELIRFRFERGLAGAQDVAQQEQQMEATRGRLILLQVEARTAAHRLDQLVGRAPGTGAGSGEAMLPDLPLLPEIGVPADLVERRPDLRAALLRLEAADARTAAAVAERLPALRLTANLFDQANTVSELFSSLFWSIGTAADQEIFAGGRRRAAVAGAEAAAEVELFEYGATLLQALGEVQDALVASVYQEEFLASLERQLDFAGIALEAALERYRQGEVDFINVLTALQTAHGVEIDLLEARGQLISSRVQLWRALGGDWRREGDSEP